MCRETGGFAHKWPARRGSGLYFLLTWVSCWTSSCFSSHSKRHNSHVRHYNHWWFTFCYILQVPAQAVHHWTSVTTSNISPAQTTQQGTMASESHYEYAISRECLPHYWPWWRNLRVDLSHKGPVIALTFYVLVEQNVEFLVIWYLVTLHDVTVV